MALGQQLVRCGKESCPGLISELAVLTTMLTTFSMILGMKPSFKNRLLGQFWAFGLFSEIILYTD